MATILVMGAGALGAYFGARLQAAGHDVTYVARGAHLEAMQSGGLRIESPLGDVNLPEVRAIGDPDDAGPADIVFLMVKNYDVEEAAKRMARSLGPDSAVVTVQNGVWAQERLGGIIGQARVLPGAVYMPADIRAPGVIRHSASFHRIVIGEWEGTTSARVEAVSSVIGGAGIECEISDDIRGVLWEKFILMSANSGLTALMRLDIGPIRETPASRELLRQAIDETAAVARAEHPSLSRDVADKVFDFLMHKVPGTMHASMLDDLRRGKRLELDYLSGDVVRRGKRLGIPTPVHAFVLAALAPVANGIG